MIRSAYSSVTGVVAIELTAEESGGTARYWDGFVAYIDISSGPLLPGLLALLMRPSRVWFVKKDISSA